MGVDDVEDVDINALSDRIVPCTCARCVARRAEAASGELARIEAARIGNVVEENLSAD